MGADGMGNDNILAHLPPLPVGQYIAHLDVSESYNGQLVNSASSDFTFNADPPTLLAQGTVFSATGWPVLEQCCRHLHRHHAVHAHAGV